MDLVNKYLGEAKGEWADTASKDGKKGNLIGYWDDLAAYYDFDGTTWKYQNRKWSNMGDTEEFKKKMKAGKWRGKLV